MISALCEFDHIAKKPSGPDIWIELSEALDRLAMKTPCPEIRKRFLEIAKDTVERREESIECNGRPIHQGDITNGVHRAYQSLLDAMVCICALDLNEIRKTTTIMSLALVAAELRGEWECQD